MKRVVQALLVIGVVGVSAMVFASAGPETVNLKEKFNVQGNKAAVIFPHHKHQEKLACTKCHPTDAGGPLKVEIKKTKGFGNDFHKHFCWPCHVEMKVPKGKSCGTCHK